MFIPVISTTDDDTAWALLYRLSTLSLVYVQLPALQLHQLASVAPDVDTDPTDVALKASILDTRTVLGPFSIASLEPMELWLEQGLTKALVDVPDDSAFEHIVVAVSTFPAPRVVLRLPVSLLPVEQPTELAETLTRLQTCVSGLVLVIESLTLSQASGMEAVVASLQTVRTSVEEGFFLAVEMKPGRAPDYHRDVVLNRIQALHDMNIHVVAPGYCRGDEAEDTTHGVTQEGDAMIDAARAFVHCLRTDRPDGLFPTVVVDEAGVALGLVYSSAESIEAAVASGRGVYYSRSRGELWKKGESSGNAQQLIQIDVDCDSDALRFMVHQTGAGFCHLNTRSCWGEDRGLRALETMLVSRAQDAPAGSYTKRLFHDAELLRHKLVEEAQELAEAETVSDVAGEAADVMYFALVRCVAAGCKLRDVEVGNSMGGGRNRRLTDACVLPRSQRMLDKRALKIKRRPGHSKAYRIAAADQILEAKGARSDEKVEASD
ncbi:hypothetical protein PsorP6_012630 [Peronosclerospora sorghi]|uniref:Uncharacterized protein n=1 Tax=Peronosclerospora sorghi TaxID=230839 RepID=A0ACC0WGJ4_9STRA|nr:hypothetical protein PsorP6_012630 [Peronosclerospora sorghi]